MNSNTITQFIEFYHSEYTYYLLLNNHSYRINNKITTLCYCVTIRLLACVFSAKKMPLYAAQARQRMLSTLTNVGDSLGSFEHSEVGKARDQAARAVSGKRLSSGEEKRLNHIDTDKVSVEAEARQRMIAGTLVPNETRGKAMDQAARAVSGKRLSSGEEKRLNHIDTDKVSVEAEARQRQPKASGSLLRGNTLLPRGLSSAEETPNSIDTDKVSVEAVSFINLVRFYTDELWRVHETRSVAHLTACCRLSLRRHGVLTVSRRGIAWCWMLTPRALNVLKEVKKSD